MARFTNRHVVVTGGTGALGTSVVRLLLEEGAAVHIPCVKEDELKRFPFQGPEWAARVRVSMGVELTDEAGVERFFASLPGVLWASIHIAGGFAMSPIDKTSAAEFAGQMRTNALTCFLCCREAVKQMRQQATGSGQQGEGRGRIVNVAARPSLEPRIGAGMVAYTAAKSAVAAITQSAAEEVAGDGILINAVVPSIMDTPANRAAMPGADHSKWPSTDSVAATIAFLASPDNTSTRGGLVPVYGRA